jgi:hypothetical protein
MKDKNENMIGDADMNALDRMNEFSEITPTLLILYHHT